MAAATVILIGFPIMRWLSSQPTTTAPLATGPVAPPSAGAQGYLNAAVRHFERGEFQECVEAAKAAIAIDAKSASAHNNAAACYGSLGKLDEEIEHATEALRIDPNHSMAKSNLLWAIEQKRIREQANAPK